jgi:AAA domain
MKLVIIFGPPAVGKMSVGQELEKVTDLKLFHNHMSLELVNKFFDFGTDTFQRLDKLIRFGVFNEVANSELEGLIFTIVWAFDLREDEDYINEVVQVFKNANADIFFIELKADLAERLKRNKCESRLRAKPSKRDLVSSENALLNWESEYRMNSTETEQIQRQILTIDNTKIEASEVAQIIKQRLYKLDNSE